VCRSVPAMVAADEQDTKKARTELPSFRLNNGAMMPAFGLGTWKSGPGEVETAVLASLECGYRHIDCASVYGNEAEVGAALKKTAIPREEIFVTSKLWNSMHAASDVEVACKESLTKLGLDFLDLYLIHWPVSLKKGHAFPPKADEVTDVPVEETWRVMETLVDKGLVKAIGVSNFSMPKLQHVLELARIKPAVNQIEGHPYLQQPALKAFCDENGVIITAYSPLGSPDRPPRVFDESDPVLLEDESLARIATELGRSPADVLIRWAVQRGTVVIPKSVTPKRIVSNLEAASKPLPEATMAALEKFDRGLRFIKGLVFVPPDNQGPFKTVQELWDE